MLMNAQAVAPDQRALDLQRYISNLNLLLEDIERLRQMPEVTNLQEATLGLLRGAQEQLFFGSWFHKWNFYSPDTGDLVCGTTACLLGWHCYWRGLGEPWNQRDEKLLHNWCLQRFGIQDWPLIFGTTHAGSLKQRADRVRGFLWKHEQELACLAQS